MLIYKKSLSEILINIKIIYIYMLNLQVIGQILAVAAIMLSGPTIIVLLALKKGNL